MAAYDGGEHLGGLSDGLECRAERQRVDDGGEHAHLVAFDAVEAARCALQSAEYVAAADDYRHFDAALHDGCYLRGVFVEPVGVDAVAGAGGKRFSAEFEEHSVVFLTHFDKLFYGYLFLGLSQLPADQKDYWTKGVNYSAKAQFIFPNVNLVLSTQKIKPSDVTVTMYDGGLTFHKGGFIAEAEYLYKHYSQNAFHDVHAFDGFVCYDIPVRNPKSIIKKVSPLARYDFMSDHSDGIRYGGSDTEPGALKINDYKRHRATCGVTFSLAKPFISDIRINFEKYFYSNGAIAKTSEKDKIVVEFMTHF